MNQKLKLGLLLYLLGLIGVLSMLTVTIPMDSFPKEVLDRISPDTLKYLLLINPAVLLLLSVLGGTLLYDKMGFSVPLLTGILDSNWSKVDAGSRIKSGILFGILTGFLTSGTGLLFQSYIPKEFTEISERIELTAFARLAYGGITEELMIRYGFMTFIVWLVSKIFGKLNNQTYIIGIAVSTILFAIGHFPVVFSAVPDPSFILFLYVFIGNSIAGVFFGWLYWKKGLEAAIVGHMFTHIVMMAFEQWGG